MKQISIFLENKPGALLDMTKVLEKHSINMHALSMAEAQGFGVAKIITDNVLETATVLKEEGYINSITEVVAADIPDEPGGLRNVLQILADAEINVEYMYAFTAETQGAHMAFKASDPAKAEKILKSKGISILTDN